MNTLCRCKVYDTPTLNTNIAKFCIARESLSLTNMVVAGFISKYIGAAQGCLPYAVPSIVDHLGLCLSSQYLNSYVLFLVYQDYIVCILTFILDKWEVVLRKSTVFLATRTRRKEDWRSVETITNESSMIFASFLIQKSVRFLGYFDVQKVLE